MMGIKVCFNDEIHRILKLPVTLTALVDSIRSIWSNTLPQNWTIYLTDISGNNINISSEDQYRDFIESHSTDSSTVKFYIVPREEIQKPEEEQTATGSSGLNQMVADVAEKLGYLEEEEVQDVKVDQGRGDGKSEQNEGSDLSTSQNKGEETGQADIDGERRRHGRADIYGIDLEKLRKIKHWLKKLAGGGLTQVKMNRIIEKLDKIREELTPEHQAKLKRKKEKAIMASVNKRYKKEKKVMMREFCEDQVGFDKIKKFILLVKGKGKEVEEEDQDLNTINLQLPLLTTAKPEARGRFNAEGKAIHQNIQCAGCGMAPIVGVRYRCSVCSYFDFCENCEETKSHPHLFLKMREESSKGIKAQMSMSSQGEEEEEDLEHGIIKLIPSLKKIKAFRKVKQMIKAMKRENVDEFNKCRNKLFTYFPEEAKQIIDTAEDWYPSGKQGLFEEWKNLKNKKSGKVENLLPMKGEISQGQGQNSPEKEKNGRFSSQHMDLWLEDYLSK